MIDKAQTEMAKTLYEQSRAATAQAYEAYAMVMRSQKTIMDSMRGLGTPFALAADQFNKLVDFQVEQSKAAMEQMDKMSAEYRKLLDQPKK